MDEELRTKMLSEAIMEQENQEFKVEITALAKKIQNMNIQTSDSLIEERDTLSHKLTEL